MQFMKKKTKIGKKTKMNKFDVFFEIEDKRWQDIAGVDAALVFKVKEAVLDCVCKDVDFLKLPKNFALNLVLSDNQTVQKLNKEFRGIDKPTNVLSFANIDDEFFDEILKNQDDIELGDVIVAFEVMCEQASELEISLKDHFCHLWVHGMLHILGYDHMIEAERLEMEQKEIEVLSKLGIENPYQE